MNPVISAPALVLLLGLVGSLAGAGCGLGTSVAALTGTLAATGTLCLVEGIQRKDYRRVAFFLVLLSLVLSAFSVHRLDRWDPLPGRMAGDFRVLRERAWGGRRLMVLSGPEGRLIARVSPQEVFPEGTRLQVRGTVVPLAHARNRGDFDEHDYWRARGVLGAVEVEKAALSHGKASLLHEWRQKLRERILMVLPFRVRGYMLASWLGDRDPDLKRKHQIWGTAHILAVSGFHVGLVCGLGYWAFRRRKGRQLAVSLLLWTYILLAGASASALRAGLMLQVMLAGSLLGRGANPLNSVAVAASLLLLWRPWWFYDVGWRLSVLAALSLAAMSRFRGWQKVLLASPAVWVITAGQVAWTFGTVPLAGLVLNLIALPLFSLLLPMAAVLSLPVLAGLPGATVLPAEGLFLLWEKGADLVSAGFPYKLHWTGGLGLLSGALFLSLICLSLGFSRLRTFMITGFLLIVSTWISCGL